MEGLGEPQSPPPAAAAIAAVLNDDDLLCEILLRVDCLNGPPKRTVHYPLYPSRYTTILPPVPKTCIHDERFTYDEGKILPNSSGGDALSLYLALGVKGRQTIVDVYAIQHDVWAIYSSVASELTGISLRLDIGSLIRDGMIYTLFYGGEIDKLFVLDLVSTSLSLVNLPEKVSSWCGKLSLADDSGVYLISLKDLQIRIWLHKMDSNGAANWFLVNTICLRAICADHMIPSQGLEDGDVHAAGFNSEFVFIEAGDALYLFDIKRKVIKKVYQVTEEDDFVCSVSPFMMVWPPKFPLVKEGRDLKE